MPVAIPIIISIIPLLVSDDKDAINIEDKIPPIHPAAIKFPTSPGDER